MRLLAAAMFLLTLGLIARAQGAYFIQKCTLTVHRDGFVHVYVEVSVDETETQIVLPLLSPPEKIVYGPFVLDENDEALYYDIDGENNTITIYSLGARQVKLEYETTGLTTMEYGLWTLRVTSPFNLTVILPRGARIFYLSAVPSEIKTVGDQIELSLYPGDWEISYEVPAEREGPIGQPPIYFYMIIISAVCAACAALLVTLRLKRRRTIKSLSDEEAEVIKFIRAKGGRALEAELRERFPHIPRTSMWRLIRRLEKRGIVQVKKVGLQNLVELK